MNNKEFPKENITEIMKEIIKNAPEKIENEFAKGFNSWLACFGSKIFQLETELLTAKRRREITEEEYKNMRDRIEELKFRRYELEKEYDTVEKIPPDEIKGELIKKLNIFE